MKQLLLLITILAFSLLLAGCPGSLISTNLNPKDVKRSHKFIHVATEAKIINGNIIVMPVPNAIIRDNDWGKQNLEPQKFIELWNLASRVSSDTNLPIGVLQWREGVDLKEIDVGIRSISSDGINITYGLFSAEFSLDELPPVIKKVQLTAKAFDSCMGLQTGIYKSCWVLTFDDQKYDDNWKTLY